MTDPSLIVNDRDMNDELVVRLDWQKTKLFRPSMRVKPPVRQTGDGPVAFLPGPRSYEPLQITIAGSIINRGSYLGCRETLQDLAKAISTRPATICAGSLAGTVYWHQADLPDSAYNRLPDKASFEFQGDMIPGTWYGLYGYAVGIGQGITVADDRPGRSDYKATAINVAGTLFSVVNPGSAPTTLALMLSCTGGTFTSDFTVYLRNLHPDAPKTLRVRMKYVGSVGKAWAYLAPIQGLVVMAGTNYLRIENSSGSLDGSGTYQAACFGTTFRFQGNSGNRFNDPPIIIHHFRRGPATYMAAGASTLSLADDMVPRIGGVVAAALPSDGIVLEVSSTNLLLNSENFSAASWTPDGVTVATDQTVAPDGASTADAIAETLTTAPHRIHAMASGLTGTVSRSVFVKTNTLRSWCYLDDGAVANATWFNLSGNGSVGTTAIGFRGHIKLVGNGWYRIETMGPAGSGMTGIGIATGDGIANYPGDLAGSLFVWGAQAENLPFATSYIKTTSASASRRADQAALATPHNYLKRSRDLTASEWIKTGLTVAKTATAGDGTNTADVITVNSVGDSIYQTVIPDVAPNSSINGIGTGWTAVWELIKGTLSGPAQSIVIQLESEIGTLIGSAVTITGDDLDATIARSFAVSVTAAQVPSGATGLRVKLMGNAGTGTVICQGVRLVRGAFPGIPVITEGEAAIPARNDMDWPWSLTQNGFIEFTAVLPPITTGKDVWIFGDGSLLGDSPPASLALFRPASATTSQNFVIIGRRSNVGWYTTSNIDVGPIWDDQPHVIRIEWLNFTRSGSRLIYLRLWIDGTTKANTQISYPGLTHWVPGERLFISDGKVQATIRDLKWGTPIWTAGDVPEYRI